MRPLKLELEGFGPYLRRQEVPLDDVSLFVITGPTGSGKTTLLDALTYALFGAVPRLGKRGAEELRHPEARRMWVRLLFRVGEAHYRVERELGPRSEVRFWELGAEGWRALPLKAREMQRRLEALLGLDYETFIRAVLLPQGEFDQLLRKASGPERREVLDRLFGLEDLKEMAKRAGERVRELEREARSLEDRLEGLQDATPEALQAKQKALEAELRKKETLEAHLNQREAEAKRLEELSKLLVQRDGLREELAALESRSATLLDAWNRAQSSRRARADLHLYQALREAEGSLAEAEREVRELMEKEGEAIRDLEALPMDEGELSRLESRWSQRGWYESLWRLLQEAQGVYAPHPQAAPWRPEDEGRLRELLKERDRLKAKEGQLAEARALDQALLQAEAASEEAQGRLNALRFARLRGLRAEAEALRGEVEALQETLDRLGVGRYRHLLRPGEPCPLCHAPVAQVPEEHFPGDLEALSQELEAKRRRLLRVEGEVEALSAQLEGLPEPPLPAAFPESKDLETAQEEAEQWERQALALEARLCERLEALDLERGKALENALAQVQEALEGLGEAAQTLARSLARYLWEALEGREPQAFFQALEERLRELRVRMEKRKRLEKRLEEVRQGLAAARAKVQERQGALQAAQAGVQGLPPEEELRGLLLPEEAEAQAEKAWQDHQQEVMRLKGALRQVEEALAPLAPLPERPPQEEAQALWAEVRRLRDEIAALNQSVGALKGEIERLKPLVDLRRELEEGLVQVRANLELWASLAEDLRQDRFPRWLYLTLQRGLLERANRLLATLSGGRYRLLPWEEKGLEYQVEDAWTGAVRSADTLSGGEAFLASLALALALSEELAGRRLEALFLDEGFGTLDGETLEVVAQALESLGQDGRMVGVITHVEALAERFPNRLRVRKGRGESTVAWEVER